MAELPDHGEIDVVNLLGMVAVASWTVTGDHLDVALKAARSFGIARSDARRLLVAVAQVARTAGCGRVRLRTNDAVVRSIARAEGFTGDLRADLERAIVGWEPGPDGAEVLDQGSKARDHGAIAAELGRLLPDTTVTIEVGGPLARLAWRSETGMAGCARVVAVRGAHRTHVVTPLGPALMVESLAAALDTLLALFARFAAVAGQIPPLVFGMAAMDMVLGHVSGQAGGGRITINPAHVRVDAVELLMDQYAAAESGTPSRFRAAARASGRAFPVDTVVAHEVGHCLDALAGGGRIADTTAFRVAIGHALGVASVELALRGRAVDSPPEWQQAHARLVEQISDYATTSGVELFAEIFATWWSGSEGPVVEAFDHMTKERFPVR